MIQTDIFLTEVYDFLKTVTIKSRYLAEKKKADLEKAQNITIEDEHDNPYYINLIGEYSDLDEPMYVTSVDDGTVIEFTKANLAIHHKTFVTYRVPNNKFSDLVAKYPHQADLIKSIMYPVSDIDTAINANNFELLAYDTSLLEDQEVSSILDALTSYLTMFRERWHIPEFYYEAYYPLTEWWLLWSILPLVILRQRVANVGTSRAHTTQIWEYLTSNGLSDYRSVLNFTEQMFLYKNLRYLIQNRGKDGTLSILSENLLYPRNAALRGKSAMLNTIDSEDAVKPSAEFISRDIRDIRTPTEAIINGIETHEKIFEREYANGLEPVLTDKIVSDQKLVLDHSKLGWLPTKLVEIQTLNIYDEFHQLYVNLMVETILYRISRDELDYNLEVKISESQTIPLSAKEAVALLFYTMGREFETKVTLTSERFQDEVIPLSSPPALPLTLTVESLIGSDITLSTGEVVTLTDLNKDEYVGMTVDIISPLVIPTTAHIVHAYKDPSPTIEQEFQFADSIWRINKLIDYDDIFTRIETNVGVIEDPERLLEVVDGHFVAMVTDINSKRAIANTAYQMAYDLLYRQILAAETVTLDFDIPYATYPEWFSGNQFLEDAINSLNSSSDVKLAYRVASDALLEAIIPITESQVTTFDRFTSEEFRLIKQMFIQLCSYNIAFLDTDIKSDTYVRFSQLVYEDKSILDYYGEIILDPDPFELEIIDTFLDVTRIYMDIVKSGNQINHSRVNNFAYLFEKKNVCDSKLWKPLAAETNVWYDTSDISSIIADGNNADQLNDKSGGGANLIPFAPENRLQTGIRSLNGLNMLDGDGTQWMECETNVNIDASAGLVIFQVAVVDTGVGGTIAKGLWSIGNLDYSRFLGVADGDIFDVTTEFHGSVLLMFKDLSGDIVPGVTLYENPPHPGPSIYVTEVLTDDTNTVVGYVDGVEVTRTFPDEQIYVENIFTQIHLMRMEAYGANVNGAFGEYIVVQSPTPALRQKIEGYLAHKWGLADNLPVDHLYKLEAPMRPACRPTIINRIANDIARFDIVQSSVYSTTKLWTPEYNGTKVVWYDTADVATILETTAIDQIGDKSGNDDHLLPQIGNTQWVSTGRTLNGLNVIDSELGQSMIAEGIPMPASGNVAVFMVAGLDSDIDPSTSIWTMNHTGQNDFNFQSDAIGDFKARLSSGMFGAMDYTLNGTGIFNGPAIYNANMNFDAGIANGYINGNKETTDKTYTTKYSIPLDLRIFANRNGLASVNGMWGEFLVIEDITESTRLRVEGYLAHKWGFVAQLPTGHLYKINPPTHYIAN